MSFALNIGKKFQTRKPGFMHGPNPGFQVWKTAGLPGSGKPGFITLTTTHWDIPSLLALENSRSTSCQAVQTTTNEQ